jgi:hypothetical protein
MNELLTDEQLADANNVVHEVENLRIELKQARQWSRTWKEAATRHRRNADAAFIGLEDQSKTIRDLKADRKCLIMDLAREREITRTLRKGKCGTAGEIV